MPSIPQSLLWISLVVLWLFVLVPMLISKRDAVRRTSDVALATRVLNAATASRLLKRAGPASGHRSDPDWRPSADDLDDEIEDDAPQRSVVVAAAVIEDPQSDYLDVDVIEEPSGALPVGESDVEETGELTLDLEEPDENVDTAVYEVATDEYEDRPAGSDDGYEYVDDSSGLEAAEDGDLRVADSLMAARRRRYDSTKAAAVSARKYKFRKRMLAFMTLVLVASATAAYLVEPMAWWVCGSFGAVTLMYLGYLRRQTRIEERVRRRRLQRIARSRLGVENTGDREFDVVPSRLRRPGAVVLEIDDEDPVFEHLEYAPSARNYDLPRAAGQ
ncbi:MAG TPA: gephyrin-like molybdotransferase receptor GlpR [Mycobacterium sp.]|nr:gephyrin-like molybdotransferase receptor GlpR [Mycobacterium sp.]